MRLLLLLLVLPLGGCFRFYVYTEPYRPVPPEIQRPTLPDPDTPFSERETLLVQYATQLEAVLREVRRQAMDANTKNGFPEDL